MKRVLMGSFLAAAFAVGLSAQTTPPQTTPPTPQSQPPAQESRDRDAAKSITVTGCLKAGDSADSFQLSDLKWGNKDKSTGAVGTSGTAAPPAAIASATSLKVVASGSTKLSEHVGHQVEVTGSISEKAASPSAAPADPASSRPSASASPTIEARSVRMVSATCTP